MGIKSKIKFLLSKLPYETYKIILTKYEHMFLRDERQRYRLPYFISRKTDSKDKYYILRYCMPQYNLFAAGIQFVFAYEWAQSNGFIPVIDIEMEYNYMSGRIGEENLWEHCFQQKLSVKEVLKKEYVLVEGIERVPWGASTNLKINSKMDDHYIHVTMDSWREYYENVNKYIKKSWVLKPDILSLYQKNYGRFKENGEIVLGVALRESFSVDSLEYYKGTKRENIASDHPLTIGVKETIELVAEYLEKWSAQKIFLSTIKEESVQQFVDVFGEKVICINRKRESFADTKASSGIWDMTVKEKYEFYQKKGGSKYDEELVIPYLFEVLCLSECDYLIAAKSSGSAAALSLNGGKYKDIYILPDFNEIKCY